MRFLATVGLAAAVGTASGAQNVTLAVTGLPTDPVPNGTAISAFVRLSWAAGGGIGYAGGAFRVRFDGLAEISDVVSPVGVFVEQSTEQIGINGAATVWSSGRRPRTLDGATEHSGGMFRLPTNSPSPIGVHYRAERQNGVLYLTARNGQSVERQIEHAQLPPALMPTDNTLFVSDASFDLFKFTIRAPLAGRGTVTITPEMISAAIFTDANGAQLQTTAEQRTMVAASFTYTPGPPAAGPLALAAIGAALRRRRAGPGGER
jgi:uncharacterized protein (TIGR03382 family)